MALSVTHSFVTAKTDGSDTSIVRPSSWNANHTITVDANTLVGKATAGTGPAEEIPVSAATIALLAAADIPSILAYLGISPATTGDATLTLKSTAPSGWLMCNDSTIGSAASGASFGSSTAQALFTLLFNNVSDVYSPLYTSGAVLTSRGAFGGNAASAWAANCQIFLTKVLGRALTVAGTGSGLSSRPLGATIGEENHVIAMAELPAAGVAISGTTSGYTPTCAGGGTPFVPGNGVSISTAFTGSGGNLTFSTNAFSALNGFASLAVSGNTAPLGSNTPHNNMQPTSFWNVMIKL